jgi:hypothetical protein
MKVPLTATGEHGRLTALAQSGLLGAPIEGSLDAPAGRRERERA